MNCKNVEPLLSLYLGGDLEEEHSRLVAGHLQTCGECTLAADEYAGVNQLLQRYEPPVFSEQIYAGVREQVLNEIEREYHAPARPGIFSQLFLALVQPRMRWVTAALILVISVTALYLSRKPSRQHADDERVAVRVEEPGGSEAAVRPENSDQSTGSSSSSNKGQIRTAITRHSINRKREARVRVAQRSVNVARPSSAPLRVELQTSNQNIRIIWLAGDERPGALGKNGSKVI